MALFISEKADLISKNIIGIRRMTAVFDSHRAGSSKNHFQKRATRDADVLELVQQRYQGHLRGNHCSLMLDVGHSDGLGLL